MMQIDAAVIREAGGPFRVEALELSGPQDHEALVRVVASGVCHADLLARDQAFPVPLPVVLGHEGAGVVEAVGDKVTTVAAGDRVAMSFSWCGRCDTCRRGRPAYCLEGFRRNWGGLRPDGTTALSANGDKVHGHFFGQSSFASHAVVPEENLTPIADDIPFELMAPLGCGVQTGAGAVINSLEVGPATSLAIFGVGSVGLSAVMAAAAIGANPIVAVDIRPGRLEVARRLGATQAISSLDLPELAVALKEASGGEGFRYAIDTTGRTEIVRLAAEALMITGTLGLVGAIEFGSKVEFDLVQLLGRTVRGVREGDSVPQIFIPQLVDLYRQGRLPVEQIVTTFPLDQINEAISATETGAVIKPVLTP
jgi:aryl-alcohol dehydrogenase